MIFSLETPNYQLATPRFPLETKRLSLVSPMTIGDLKEKFGIPYENIGVSNEKFGSSMKILKSLMKMFCVENFAIFIPWCWHVMASIFLVWKLSFTERMNLLGSFVNVVGSSMNEKSFLWKLITFYCSFSIE